jgi:CO/xanthine dehydrogenase FAD-binding subunit
MRDLAYVRAPSLDEAVAFLNEPGRRSQVLAGGTDLVRQICSRAKDFDCLVDVSRIPELRSIDVSAAGAIRFGAGVTFTEVLQHPLLAERAPLLAEACRTVGGVQVRNQATVGGNVANGAACADVATVLVCLEAVAVIAGPGTEDRARVSDLLADPQTHLPPGRLIRSFEFEAPHDRRRTVYLRLGRRQAMSIARASVAAVGEVDDRGRTKSVWIAAGAVFEHPRRLPEVEALLQGEAPSEPGFVEAGRRAAEIVVRECGDRWSAPYKQVVVATLVERALRAVLGAPA